MLYKEVLGLLKVSAETKITTAVEDAVTASKHAKQLHEEWPCELLMLVRDKEKGTMLTCSGCNKNLFGLK